jgi:rod shape-determining protein MreC
MEVNGKFSNFLLFSLCLFFFIAIFLQTHKELTFIKSTFSSFNNLLSNFLHFFKENTRSIGENFREVKELRKEKEELEKVNLSLKAKIFNLENELQKYKKIVNLFENPEFELLVAETIGWDITNPYNGIVINKGEKDGVKTYYPVIDIDFNLVGRVSKTSSNSSEVILITSADFSASVKIKEGVFAIISGENSSLCILNYITEESAVEKGMEIFTSGFDRVFPKGLKVGKIEKIINSSGNIRSVMVKPYANLKSLDTVLILKK